MSQIEVFLRGGLGNQLFQYAMGLYISKKFGQDLVIREDLLPKVADSINGISRFPNHIASISHKGKMYSSGHQPPNSTNFFGKWMALERMLGDAFPNLFKIFGIMAGEKSGPTFELHELGTVRRINSYANSKIVVDQVIDDLREQLTNLSSVSGAYESLVIELKKERRTVLHLRLGDYLGLKHIYGSLTLDYVQSSLKEIDREGLPIWIMTQSSDQIPEEFIRYLNPELIIDERVVSAPIENLLILSQADTLLCSNSTFSWWGAMLARKSSIVVAPRFASKFNIFEESQSNPDWVIKSLA